MTIEKQKKRLWPDIIYVDQQGAIKTTKSLDIPFREGFGYDLVVSQIRYMEKVLSQAELAVPREWSKILAVQQTLPSVRRLIQHSPLEMNAAVLFTTLAYSPQSQWRIIIQEFFKKCSLAAEIPRGRPRLNPSKVTALACGKLIEEAETKLKHGFTIKAAAKRNRGFSSGDEQIETKLRACGYDNQQIEAILIARNIRDAACRYFEKIQGTPHRSLKRIRNIYWEYKNLKKRA
jgi:hypothetical protein